MISKRMKVALIAGGVLGIFCIIGALIRSGFQTEAYLLFALWYNRLLMGFVIGLRWNRIKMPILLIRGAVLGLFVSFAFYSATGFTDLISFLAGIIYGMIIEYLAFRFGAIEKVK